MCLTLLATHSAFGQALPPVFDPTLRSGEPRAPLKKEFEPPKVAPPPQVLPPAPLPPEGAIEPGAPPIAVFAKEINVVGSTVFSEEELAQVTAPFTNRRITSEELEQLRLALSLLYVRNGYVTSGAIIPDQDVSTGVITIQVIEGRLTRIEVEGIEWFRPRFLQDRLELGIEPPLQIADLQQNIQLLQQNPNVRQVNAELRPGDVRGEGVLNVRVVEHRPIKAFAEFNNFQTPAVGAERGLGTILHQNLTGNSDPFSFTYGRSDGVDPIIDILYSLPFTKYDTTFTASYRRNQFLVVEDPFDTLKIESESEIFGFTLWQPLYRTLNQQLAVSLTGEHLFNKTTLSDDPFEFVPGAKDGVSTISALRFGQEWVYRGADYVLAARPRFSIGLDVLRATINAGQVADGQFASWLGQAQGIKRFDELGGTQLLTRMDLQLADDRLFPLEQIPVGGRFSVRGYRENQVVRDNAFIFSVESRIPLYRSPEGRDILQLAPFVDVGRSWNTKGDTPSPDTLASIGVGLRWDPLPENRAHFEVYWGQQLNHISSGTGNLQDHGVHLQAVIQVY